jgi:hypothetical protein
MFLFRCVIAELFLEGQQLFELSQLLAYRRGQYDPSQYLEKVLLSLFLFIFPSLCLVHYSSINIFVRKSVFTHQEKNKRGGVIICEACLFGFFTLF